MIEGKLRYEDLGIGLSDICVQMGYGDNRPDDSIMGEIQVVAEHVRRILVPRFCFSFCHAVLDETNDTLSITESEVACQTPTFNIGRIITRQIRGSLAYALFVCTSGAEFETFRKQLHGRGDMVKTFIADAMGSVIAEKTADYMETALRAELPDYSARQNTGDNADPWHSTNRFSPGYCGWHVSEQHKLFSLFPTAQPCGVRLTPSALMLPIKSVSGIIGLGPTVRHMEYTCGLCDYMQCYKRRKRQPTDTTQ